MTDCQEPLGGDVSNVDWIVIATATAWSELPRLRHQVTRALSRYYRVLYIHFSYEWRRKHTTHYTCVEPNITVWCPSNILTVPEPIAARVPLVGVAEELFFKLSVQRVLKRMKIKPIAVINFDHRHHWIQDHRLFPRAIYICNDDFSGLARRAGNPRVAMRRAKQMRSAAQRSDVSLATSEHIARILEVGEKARVFYPGHDLPVPDAPRLDDEHSSGCIKVGYMGYIDSRLNVAWIRTAAARCDIEFHVIGPISSTEVHAALLSSNVKVHSPLTGKPLLEWLQGMDVLTIPFDLEQELAPAFAILNKTFFYLAAGKPIVVSDLRGFVELGPDIVYRAGTAEEFVNQIRRARWTDDTDKVSRRLHIAREHTWEKRIKIICDLIGPGTAGPFRDCRVAR